MRKVALFFALFAFTATLYSQVLDLTPQLKGAKTATVYMGASKSLVAGASYDVLSLTRLTSIKDLDLELNTHIDLNNDFGVATLITYTHAITSQWLLELKLGPAFMRQNDSFQFLEYGASLSYLTRSNQQWGIHIYSGFLAFAYTLHL